MRFYKYSDLIKANTNYASRMKMLSNHIFGEVVRPTNEKSMRVIYYLNLNLLYYFLLILLLYLGSEIV